jgi:hypothetical protein
MVSGAGRTYVVAAAVAALMAGCGASAQGGGGAADRAQVRTTLERLQSDFAAGRMDDVCQSMTPQVHTQIGNTGHAHATECPKDMERFVGLLKSVGGFGRAPRVEGIEVHGGGATAAFQHADGTRTELPVRRRDGHWELSNLFGATTLPSPEPDAPATFELPGSPAPISSGDAVVVTEAGGRHCPGVEQAGGWPPTGGCVVGAPHGTIESSVRTPLGTFLLARCPTRAKARLAGDGRIWIEDYEMARRSDAVDAAACGDVEGCRNDRSIATAWDGELRASPDGRFVGHVDVCMATCVGRFEGRAEVVVTRRAGGWRLSFEDAAVGNGGLELDGSWPLRSSGVQLNKVGAVPDRAS